MTNSPLNPAQLWKSKKHPRLACGPMLRTQCAELLHAKRWRKKQTQQKSRKEKVWYYPKVRNLRIVRAKDRKTFNPGQLHTFLGLPWDHEAWQRTLSPTLRRWRRIHVYRWPMHF